MCDKTVNVTVWNEFRHEKSNEAVKKLYPEGMHKVIADSLEKTKLALFLLERLEADEELSRMRQDVERN